MIKYKCSYCEKEDEYDEKTVVKVRDLKESQDTGKDVIYFVTKCKHCDKRNQMKPPPGMA